MAQVITIAGERLFALKAQNNERLDIDTFIFANVPGQDPNAAIDRNEGLPPAGQQVFTQIVQQVGRVNDNVVIYSTVLDSLTGPFEFNWVGLYSSVNQTLIAISHIPTVQKTVTVPGAAGNTLNRNFGIEYSGIADLTGITVAPETWQLDYTARLNGMDELTRQLAADMNGKDWFIGDGFKVVPRSTLNTFKVTPGAGYVSGLRVELAAEHILTLSSYPQFVYVDAWFDGTAGSQWKGQTAFTVTNTEMDDYIDVNGKQHYVFKLASITAADEVKDLRSVGGLADLADLASSGVGIGQRFMTRIKSGQVDANLLVVGDSTGNESFEWVYQLGLHLASKYPTHTVKYHLWSTVLDDYSAAVDLNTGTSSRIINIYNGSIGGSTCSYFLGQRKNKVFSNTEMDLIIQNYGHNQGTNSTLERIVFRLTESVSQFVQAQPNAEIVLTLQNEDLGYLEFSEKQAYATSLVAEFFGLACIDVREVFLQKRLTSDVSEWMSDNVHPNALGQKQWLNVITKALDNPKKHNSVKINPLANQVKNPIRNSHLYDWVWTKELPAGFTKVGTVTVSKDNQINESLNWSLKAVNGATSLGEIRFDMASFLRDRPKGVDAVLCVRLLIDGNSTTNSGRIEITSNLGSISTSAPIEVRDGWFWAVLSLPSNLLDEAISLRGSVYVGSNIGDTVYIDRVQLVSGYLPADTYFTQLVISDYYFPENVAPVGGADITVTGNTVEVNTTPAAFAEFLINVTGLEVGRNYTITWTRVDSGGSATAYNSENRSGGVISSTSINDDILTWTATAETNSIAFNAPTGTLTLLVEDISIVAV